MIIGTVAAVGTGAAMPLAGILFGQLIDNTQITSTDLHSIAEKMKPTSFSLIYIGAGTFVAAYLMFAFWMMVGERVAL